MENLKQLQTQTDTITQDIADVKQTIVDRLDSFEHALLSELSTMQFKECLNILRRFCFSLIDNFTFWRVINT
jgi:isoleucyl-tRNA synthetase